MYVKVAYEPANSDFSPDNTTRTVNGVTYQGIGTITQTLGYNNIQLAKISRQVGFAAGSAAGGKLAWDVIWPKLGPVLKNVASYLGNEIKTVWSSLTEGATTVESGAVEGAAMEADAEAEIALTEAGVEVGVDVTEVAAEGAAVTVGSVLSGAFVAVGIILAIGFIVASFILHNSFHRLRVWNLTKYKIEWTVTYIGSNEGQMISGPIVVADGKTTNLPIKGVSAKSVVPGIKGEPHANYADFKFASSSERAGISYVIQCTLIDSTGSTQFVVTTYYDIPFAGDNSTNITVGPGVDAASWGSESQGNNPVTKCVAKLDGDNLMVFSTYDFLDGQHAMPGAAEGESSNEGYYYNSILAFVDNTLKISNL